MAPNLSRRTLLKAAAAGPGLGALAVPAGAADAPPPLQTGVWTHGLCAYGPLRRGPDFGHYPYADPQAPKGGTLRLSNSDRRSSFDKLNPFSVKGVTQAALQMFVFETLCDFPMDEPLTMYGLLAEAMYVEPDLSAISFRLRREARFSNGDPLTAADVVDSVQRQQGKLIRPDFATPLQAVSKVVAVDAHTVRFELSERTMDAVFALGSTHVFSRRWGEGKALADMVNEVPIATGPYTVDVVEMPSRIEFKRQPGYWAKDLAVRRGFFNFDRIAYRLYQDDAVRREAFKAGEFDLLRELSLGQYMRSHQGAKWRDGRIVKRAWPVATGSLMQAMDFNLRRPKFQDIRVREAIMRAWDFETPTNRYGYFKRANSAFNNTEFAAQGEPTAAELALLEPFRAELPKTVFGPAFVAPRTDTSPHALRDSLKTAARLLSEAGWNVATDGVLRNAQGQAFEMEMLEPSRPGRYPEFERNLKRLGIQYTERLVDFSLYNRRLTSTRDFDLVIIVEGKFTLPNAGDLYQLYHSSQADKEGSQNYRGVKSRAVDALIERISQARTMDELRTAAHALDRVVMWNHWQIPQLYGPGENTSYWNKFGIPAVTPLYFQIDSIPDEHSRPWPLWCWWDKASDQRPALPAPKG
jgi:peptide/nickel transport system substrate-binding protein/microcin C transport system substrate-binding protein